DRQGHASQSREHGLRDAGPASRQLPMTHNPVVPPKNPLTRNIFEKDGSLVAEPLNITEYEKRGGYHAVRRALKQMASLEVTNMVKEANLRGRGGAGFPTGVKWGLTAMDKHGEKTYAHKYFVANGDEME